VRDAEVQVQIQTSVCDEGHQHFRLTPSMKETFLNKNVSSRRREKLNAQCAAAGIGSHRLAMAASVSCGTP
jgi:hypothetical protein